MRDQLIALTVRGDEIDRMIGDAGSALERARDVVRATDGADQLALQEPFTVIDRASEWEVTSDLAPKSFIDVLQRPETVPLTTRIEKAHGKVVFIARVSSHVAPGPRH